MRPRRPRRAQQPRRASPRPGLSVSWTIPPFMELVALDPRNAPAGPHRKICPVFRARVRFVTTDYTSLPPDLPAPQDDGAADHLPGMRIPALTLESSAGPVDLTELASERAVIYVYPRTGTPG